MNQATTNDDPDRKDDGTEDPEIVTPDTDAAASASDPEPVRDPVPEADHEPAAGVHDEEHQGGSTVAGMALRFLIIVLVVFGLSLWLVPMIAPHLPSTIARHIMPGQKELDTRLAALDTEVRERTDGALADVAAMKKQVADLTKRLAEAEAAAAKAGEEAAAARAEAAKSAKAATTATVAEDVVTKAEGAARAAAGAAETATTAATEAGKVAVAATRDAASLARRMTSFDARVAALSSEIGAMGEALAKAPSSGGDGAASPELAAAFAALKAKVDGLSKNLDTTTKFLKAEDADRFATQDDLRSARTALQAEVKERIAALPAADKIVTEADLTALKSDVDEAIKSMDTRVATVETTASKASAAAKAASEASQKAEGKVETAIRDASVRSAVAALMSRLDNGVSYGPALAELEKLTAREAPAELRAAAGTGVATADDLRRGFGRKAQAAISADIRAAADDDGVFGKASARLRSVVAGRPKKAEEGEDTAAIVSRIEASLREGNLVEALAESQTLSDPAKAAMSGWLDRLSAKVAADKAAKAFIDELTRQQG